MNKEIIDKKCYCGHLQKQDHGEVFDWFGHDYKEKCKLSFCNCKKFVSSGWCVVEDNLYNYETGRYNDIVLKYIEKYRGSDIF